MIFGIVTPTSMLLERAREIFGYKAANVGADFRPPFLFLKPKTKKLFTS
jgi:hypothetical protein